MRRGCRGATGAGAATIVFVGFWTTVSLPFPFASTTALTLLLTDFPVTSPRASRFLLFWALISAKAEYLLDALGAAVVDGGFARVAIRDGLAFAFSFSLAVERVTRVTLRG